MLVIRSLLVIGTVLAAGCHGPALVPPNTLTSPYDVARGEVLWAVVPLSNESGTSILDPASVSDAVVRACQQIEGIRCLPLNRVIAEMRGLNMAAVRSPSEAAVLAERLGVNVLIVGTITDYDPYDPPRLGFSLVLETAGNLTSPDSADFGLDALRGSVGEDSSSPRARVRYEQLPSASASVVLDGRNHATLMELRRFAEGRHDPSSARGWEGYLASMPLYTEFAAHAAVSRLLDLERLRLARAGAARVSAR
ncbi:MAG: hypothetical protein AAGF47_00030 [Planctomycetota bacterium]